MKKKLQRWIPSVMVGIALTASSSLCYGASDIIFGPQGTEAGISNPDGTWIHMWGSASAITTTFDTANPPPSGDTAGSVYNQANWTGNAQDDYNMVSPGTWWGGVVFDGSQYSDITFDFKYDTTSTITPSSAAHVEIAFDGGYSEKYIETIDGTTIDPATSTLYFDGNWHHVDVPISANMAGISTVDGVSYYQWNASARGTMNFWMANLKMIARIVQAAPPTMSIKKVKPGLNFVQGSISGQFDRQSIRTVNSTTGTPINYSWVGAATAGNPVTYSFNISQWTAPDLNFHIYITPGVGGESASDYNETNVMILQIGQQPPDGTVVRLIWKTNFPSFNGTNMAVTVTNQSLLGTWKLRFTSDTDGAIIAPDSTSYPFVVDPGLVTGLANPVYITFGLNPSVNSPAIVGESVVVSQIAIQGVGSLSSVATVTNDNFLADSQLDTNSWVVNALYAPSIWFVPTNTAYSIDWTLPDSGFSLIQSPSLLSLSIGTPVQFPVALLTPGARELIPSSSLPAGNSGFFALIKRTYTQLQVLVPGETAAPNTPTGKTGTPILETNGMAFDVIVNAVDANFNVVNNNDQVQITDPTDSNFECLNGTDGTGTMLYLANGTATFSVEFTGDGSSQMIVTDQADTSKTGTSAVVTY
jgi:hypothetical protein